MRIVMSRQVVAGGAAVLLALSVAVPTRAEWEKGVEAYNKKDWATAVKEFEDVITTNPDFAAGYHMLGVCQTNLDQKSPAVANLRKAVELEPANTEYKLSLALALINNREHQQAYGILKPLDPATVDARLRSRYALRFAAAATKTGHSGEAIGVLTAQIRSDPSNPRLHQALGVAHSEAGDDGKAFDAFKRAFELDPKKDQDTGKSAVNAAINAARRATADADKGRYYSEAAQIAEKLAAASATFEHNLLVGETWLGAQQYQKALGWFDQAQSMQPKNVRVHFYRAQCKTSLNQLDAALVDLQAALSIGATDPTERRLIYNQLGYVYDKKTEYLKAADAYREGGNQGKAAEMQAKQSAKEQNLQASKEQEELRRNIKALELQIKELEQIGEMDDANQLRTQLEELKKHLQ
jgi:tetratricopeptide (TPR) repeat protein